MKYGLIKYKNKPYGRDKQDINDKGLFNIGDNIQMIAIKRIYTDIMNVPLEDIIEIDFHDLSTYKGDYVLVLINLFFFGCHDLKEKWFPASPYIIPIFIGLHLSSRILTENEVSYFRNYAPIGCRDEFTLSTMRNYGIEAYLFGCVTATLPRRSVEGGKRNTIFLVDVDEDQVIKRLPAKYKKYEVESIHHVMVGDFSLETYKKADEMAMNLIKRYSEEAVLVLTSRLHCASPCAAMGIPTIMIVKEKSQRYSWLDCLINIYTEEEYDIINWDISGVHFEELKTKMISYVIKRIKEESFKREEIFEISSYFEKERSGYKEPFNVYFSRLVSLASDKTFSYYIWGATALAEETYSFIKRHYPNNNFLGLIDQFNSIEFMGRKSITFSEIMNRKENVVILVTPTSAIKAIKEDLVKSSLNGMALFTDGSVVSLGSNE